MFLSKTKNKLNYLENLIRTKDIEIEILKDEVIELKEVKTLNINRCECGHECGLDRLILFDSDGYNCSVSSRYEDGSYDGKLKRHIRLFVCPKCGIVKGNVDN